MMTGLDPEIVQGNLRLAGYEDTTVQNYGFTVMTNLEVMAQVVDRWLLELDQPKHIVLAIADLNFRSSAGDRNRVQDSPLENIRIFPDTLDDFLAATLYDNLVIYRYAILARNATFIPVEETRIADYPAGGYTSRNGIIDCDSVEGGTNIRVPVGQERALYTQENLSRLDALIDAVQSRNIPVLVVSIPMARCLVDNLYGSVDRYRSFYLDLVFDHLHSRRIPYVDLDEAFYNLPLEDQNDYFGNGTHPNARGAGYMSQLLAYCLDEWLTSRGEARSSRSSVTASSSCNVLRYPDHLILG